MPFVIAFLQPYQKLRILTFLNPDRDPLGAGYQIIQSKIAVGSGGLNGKGFLNHIPSLVHFLHLYSRISLSTRNSAKSSFDTNDFLLKMNVLRASTFF